MSNLLAIAAVTHVMKDILDNGAVHLPSVVSPLTVSVLPPDRVMADIGSKTRLNLFLYQVTPNQGWRNVDLPSRNGVGDAVRNPPLGLDLHYIITAYGVEEYHTEVLLGYAAQLFHVNPILTRGEIRNSLDAIIAPKNEFLRLSDLADQIELIKFTPESFNIEEMSKLWAAFQGKYGPSLSYKASVVLIDSTVPVRSPLPVLTRGADDRGAQVSTVLDAPYPSLSEMIAPRGGSSACLGDQLTLAGQHLDGSGITVRIRNLLRNSTEVISTFLHTAPGQVVFVLPGDRPGLRVGVYSATLLVTQNGMERQTNEVPFMIAPTISIVSQQTTGTVSTFIIGTTPEVLPEQEAMCIIGDREAVASARAANPTKLTFSFDHLLPGTAIPIRLRIAGIESVLLDRTTTPPQFVQTVSIP